MGSMCIKVQLNGRQNSLSLADSADALGKQSMNNFSFFLLGSLVTLVCAFIPFWMSSRQLQKEAQRLVKLSNLVTRGMEESGIVRFNRNPAGEAIGLVIDEQVIESAFFSSKAEPSTSSRRAP